MLKWFKPKRKQCESCFRTFYKPKIVTVMRTMYRGGSRSMVIVDSGPPSIEKIQACPHCEHPKYIIV